MRIAKQKWTAEEEAVLMAGINKHGAGKWRIILQDPEFGGVLHLRSNVDLKDKWRTMKVRIGELGFPRDTPKLTHTGVQNVTGQDVNNMAVGTCLKSDEEMLNVRPLVVAISSKQTASTCLKSDEEMLDVRPLVVAISSKQTASPDKSKMRLDNLIVEAITSLKEPGGSNKQKIASCIEEDNWPPDCFMRKLSARLKHMTTTGKLIKNKQKYSIAPNSAFSNGRRNPSMLSLEKRQRFNPGHEREDSAMPTKSQINFELAKMRTMTGQEVAVAVTRAVSDADTAIAEAEEAAREAEAVKAKAKVARALAEAALKMLKEKTTGKVE